MRLIGAFVVATLISFSASAQQYPVVTGGGIPLILGTTTTPAFADPASANGAGTTVWIDQQGVLGNGTVVSRFTNGGGGGPGLGQTPTFLRLVNGRGTPDAPVANAPGDFVGEIRGEYTLTDMSGAPWKPGSGCTIDFLTGWTTRPKLGQQADGTVSVPGNIRFRCAADGNQVPLPVLYLQQSVSKDAKNFIVIWNANEGGDVQLSAVTSGASTMPAGINISTQYGGTVKFNGVDVMARITAIEAKQAAHGW
jgi:hypothetical protein